MFDEVLGKGLGAMAFTPSTDFPQYQEEGPPQVGAIAE